jgi:hypothetical protein
MTFGGKQIANGHDQAGFIFNKKNRIHWGGSFFS